MKRFLFLTIFASAIFCLFAVSASAQVVNYEDYVVSDTTEGAYDYVNVDPGGVMYWSSTPNDLQDYEILISSSRHYEYFIYNPFLDMEGNRISFSREQLPAAVHFQLRFLLTSDYYLYEAIWRYVQYDSNGNVLSTTDIDTNNGYDTIIVGDTEYLQYIVDADSRLVYHPNTYSISFFCLFEGRGRASSLPDGGTIYWYRFFSPSGSMTFRVPSAFRDNYNSGLTPSINGIENQLSGQQTTLDNIYSSSQDISLSVDDILAIQGSSNDLLDDLVNGSVNGVTPNGNGTINDLDQAESEIRDDAESGMEQGVDIQTNALEVLADYVVAFDAVRLIFNCFFEMPFFQGIISISFGLGIVAVILNIIIQSGLRMPRYRGGKASVKSNSLAVVNNSKGVSHV